MEWIALTETDSTNRAAKALARQGAAHGTVVSALRQTAGRGRLGRTFFSPEGGIYLSVILRPKLPPEDWRLLTPMAAVAVCRTTERLCGVSPRIKWVNDLYLEGKKLCGILCEAAGEAVIVGIGLNYAMPPEGFPPDIPATALYPSQGGPVRREELARAMAQAVLAADPLACMPEYRSRNLLPGKTVTVHPVAGPAFSARALDIDARGRLIVECEQGILTLDSGEVSVRF